MHFKPLALVAVAAFFLTATPALAEQCCDKAPMPCCTQGKTPCCDHNHKAGSDVALLGDIDMNFEPVPAPPVRQLISVWLMRPVKVGETILQGRYVIEHDTDRMARGEPCTHIYAYDDQKTPVVTFHCLHLERDKAGQNTVVLYTAPDGLQRLAEFQFSGETASHGNPSIR